MVEFIQFVLLWWYEQNTLELFPTGIIISRISHLLENHMSVAIWSLTSFINAVILVHRHKPSIIVVLLFTWESAGWYPRGAKTFCAEKLQFETAASCCAMWQALWQALWQTLPRRLTRKKFVARRLQRAPCTIGLTEIHVSTWQIHFISLTNPCYNFDKSIYYMLNIFDISVLQLCC